MRIGKRIGIYLRVSTSEQSTELQLREINQFLDARGWQNREIYEDSGLSGANSNRPQLKRLLSDVKQRKIDIVICWKMDRLFRSLKDLIVTLQEFSELGIEFISLKDNVDLSTSSGKLLMHLLGAFAEFERNLIVERVRAGLVNAKAKGKRLGRPIKRNEEEIRTLRTNGLSIRSIAKELKISKSTVQSVVSRKPLQKSRDFRA
jgi:DNA invertase Pin-like site-specific DNA recombinase